MKLRMMVWLAAAVCTASSWLGAAEKAEDVFRAGEARLASGDLQGALQQFAKAVRADQTNQDYRQHYAMVRQVLMMRDSLPKEKDAAQWEYMARALHTFYIGNGLYADALAIDQQMHAKLNPASSALLLAETQLAMNKPAEAAAVLGGLPAERHDSTTRAIHGLALARQGKMAEAKRVAQSVQLASDAGPGAIYAVARCNAAVGNLDPACRMRVRCFESSPPSRLEGFKQHAKTSPEFAALTSHAGFAAALQTGSKVAESQCSGGSSCATCPMRGKCASGAQ